MKTLRKSYEIDGDLFICKVPDASDLWAMNGSLPILPTVNPGDAEAVAEETVANPEKMTAMLEWADRLIIRCGIEPKFIDFSPSVVPEGYVPIRELNPFLRLELSTLLMRDAQFTKESAQRVVPISATEGDSSPSTP